MKNNIHYYFLLITLAVFIACRNNPSSKNENATTKNNSSIEKMRYDYLKKKEWVAPEDMLIIEKGFTPPNERGLWDENKRKQEFIDKLKRNQIPDSTIQNFVGQLELIHGARTGQWNYEYIHARFEVYKNEMADDEEWKKIESEYRKTKYSPREY